MKFRIAFVALLGIFSLTACENKEKLAEVRSLEAENIILKQNVDSLNHVIDSLKCYGDSVKKSLEMLDMGI